MAPQRYQRVASDDDDHTGNSTTPAHHHSSIPSSPPPSFRSQASSPTRHLLDDNPSATEAERTLADTFDSPSDDEGSDDDDGHGVDDRQRLMRANSNRQSQDSGRDDLVDHPDTRPGQVQRRVTQLPVFAPQTPGGSSRTYGGGNMANDGVFANLSAKPTRGEEVDEKPPTYEQAAADATPPYWETTILAPGMVSDEVFVDGLPVGSVFSFVWNGMISMSFQLVGFVLTYLLHTTHAAKNGSLAGLGITLVQYGFQIKGSGSGGSGNPTDSSSKDFGGPPPDPNSHDFDPNAIKTDQSPGADDGGFSANEWLAYILMIVGWFILIRSISDYLRARRHEQLVLQSPDRGLGVAVVAEGERPESSV